MNLLTKCKVIFKDNNEQLFEMPIEVPINFPPTISIKNMQNVDEDLCYLALDKTVIFIDLQTKKQYVYELKDINTIDVEYNE